MRIRILIASVVLTISSTCAAQWPAPASISALIDRIGSATTTPVINVAVTTTEALCYASTYRQGSGVTVMQEGSTDTARFHAASISKLFTATVIMQLRDEAKISLNDTAGTYVPEFRRSEIRIKHLLTHTSGLRDRKRANGRVARKEVDAYIKNLAKQKLKNRPGSVWRYADASFNLLGRVIENVSQQPFSDVMTERLLRPLEMHGSSFDISQIPADARVPAFDKRGKPTRHPWDLAFLPSSGLQTNTLDLSRFGRAVLAIASGQELDGFLEIETLKEMTVPRIDTDWDGVKQGYGWQLTRTGSRPVWRHAGSEAGYEGLFVVYPEDGLGITVFGNQKEWPRFQLVTEIGGVYLQK